MAEERLQKILSQAGVASRRQAEKIMAEGRVAVNGTVITELGSKADIERDHIKVDGKLIHAPKRQVYVALCKPNNTVTTVSDPEGRATVMDLLHGLNQFPLRHVFQQVSVRAGTQGIKDQIPIIVGCQHQHLDFGHVLL